MKKTKEKSNNLYKHSVTVKIKMEDSTMCLVGFSYISTKNKNNKQTAYVDSNTYCAGSLCMKPMVVKEKQDLLAEYLRGQIEDHGISFMGDNM